MTPFTMPQILDLAVTPLELTPGTYTDLVNETWNGRDVDSDSTLQKTDAATSTLEANGGELTGAQDAVTALSNHGQNLPNGGSSTFTDDMKAASAAQQAKTDALTASLDGLPPLLQLPLNPAGNPYVSGPPTVIAVDVGNLTLNGAAYTQYLGRAGELVGGGVFGIQSIWIADQYGAAAQILEVDTENNIGNQFQEYTVSIVGTTLGKFTVQVEYNTVDDNFLTIVTYTGTVVAAAS